MSKELGNTLYFLRKQQNFTQKAIAYRLGVDRSSYSNYERGVTEPDSKRLKMLADIFGVSVDYLFTGENEESKVADVKSGKSRLENQVGLLTRDELDVLVLYRVLNRENKEEIKKIMERMTPKN